MTLWPCGHMGPRDKLKTKYLLFRKAYDYHTWQGGDSWWGKLTHNLRWLSNYMITWRSPRHSVTINLVPTTSFCFKVKTKKLWGQGCLTTGKRSFTVFCCRNLSRKMSKWQIFLSTHPSSRNIPTATGVNQTILWWRSNTTQKFL